VLPSDPGPGAGAVPPSTPYPAPLDLTVPIPGLPSIARFGPAIEWKEHEGTMKLVVAFATNTPVGILWRVLEPDDARRLLEWMLKSVEAAGA